MLPLQSHPVLCGGDRQYVHLGDVHQIGEGHISKLGENPISLSRFVFFTSRVSYNSNHVNSGFEWNLKALCTFPTLNQASKLSKLSICCTKEGCELESRALVILSTSYSLLNEIDCNFHLFQPLAVIAVDDGRHLLC